MQNKILVLGFEGCLMDTSLVRPYYNALRATKGNTEEYYVRLKELRSHMDECRYYDGIKEVLDYYVKNNINYLIFSRNYDKFLVKAAMTQGKESFKCKRMIRPIEGRTHYAIHGVIEYNFKGQTPSDAIMCGRSVKSKKDFELEGASFVACRWATPDEELKQLMTVGATIIDKPCELLKLCD